MNTKIQFNFSKYLDRFFVFKYFDKEDIKMSIRIHLSCILSLILNSFSSYLDDKKLIRSKIKSEQYINIKTVNLQDRVDKLNKSAAWKKTIKSWNEQGKVFDISRLPKVSMEKLGVLDIDEDIQRELDEKHCANRIANPALFDPALLQPVICIKTSKGKFISIEM